MTFFARLEQRAKTIDSLLCVGLDPHPHDLAEPTAQAAFDFCRKLVEATSTQALAYKPNSAFFEAFGPDGMQVLKDLIATIPDYIPVLLDAKRGDIGSTAEAYARAAFEQLGADAITINPYLGRDSLLPFTNYADKGIFVLCKTSNPSADELQEMRNTSGESLYQQVVKLAQDLNIHANVGLVIGATQVEAIERVRQSAPAMWILAPGIGPQGGQLDETLKAGIREDGLGLLIPMSRSIGRAADPTAAAQAVVSEMRKQVKTIAVEPSPSAKHAAQAQSTLYEQLLETGCVRFGEFKLKSGLQSPFYIDLRRLVAFPDSLSLFAKAYLPILSGLEFDRIAALPYAALPLGTQVAVLGQWPLIYPRKEAKSYGTGAAIEGLYEAGERVVVLDDLATTGGSKFEAIEKLEAEGLLVSDVVVLLDRESGAREALAEKSYTLHSVFALTEMLDYWESNKLVLQEQIDAARQFIATSQ